MTDVDLDALHEHVASRASALGLHVYPAFLERTPEWLRAVWPNEDWQAFLEMGASVGVAVVYLDTERFSGGHYVELVHKHEDALPADHPLWDEVEGRLEQPDTFDACWVHGGVLHHWWREAPWYEDLVRRLDEATNQARQEQSQRDQQLAREVAERAAGNKSERDRLVKERLGDASGPRIMDVQRLASEIESSELLPAREAAIADKARELMKNGSTKKDAAAHFRISTRVLDRVLQQYAVER